MPATIRTELTDNSKEWGDGLKRQFNEAKASAAGVSKSFESISQSLDLKQSEQYQAALKQVADQLDRASSSAQQMVTAFSSAAGATSDQCSALQQLDEAARTAGQNVGTLDSQVGELNQAMDASEAAKFRKAIDDVAESAGKGAKGAGNFAGSWTDVASKMNVASQSFDLVKQGAAAVGSAISALSGAGVPAFQKLTAAGGRVQDALLKIGENPAVQRFAEMVAKAIDENVVPAIEWVAKNIGGISDTFADVTARAQISFEKWKEFFGIGTKGKAEALEQANEVRIALREQSNKAIEEQNAKRQQERERQKQEAIEDFADPGKHMREDAASTDRIKTMNHVEDVERQIELEKKRQAVRVQAIQLNAGDLATDREVTAGKELLIKLEQRRYDLMHKIGKEVESEDQAEQVANEQAADFQEKEVDRIEEKADKEEEASNEREVISQKAESPKPQKPESRANGSAPTISHGGAAILMGAMTGGFDQNQDMMQGVMDDSDAAVNAGFMQMMQMQKSMILIKKREKDALEKWRKEQKSSGLMSKDNELQYEQDVGGNVKQSQFGNKLSLTSTQRKAKTKSAEARIKKEARKGFRKDAAKGNISSTEIAAAQNDAVTEAVSKVKSDGKVTVTQIKVLETMADQLKNANAENAKHEETLKMLLEALTAGQNQRGPGGQNNVAKAQNTN
jgi:hypothetical protein